MAYLRLIDQTVDDELMWFGSINLNLYKILNRFGNTIQQSKL